jgi:DNA polymerase-4
MDERGRGPAPGHPRTIIHIDMDAFFAAVEVLDNPTLRGKPVVVGGTVEGHGIVSTASYEARRFGIHSAMPMAWAVKLCPGAVFVGTRGDRYAAVSRDVFRVLEEFTPLVEPVSIDEAFLDITGTERLSGPPAETARAIKRRVREVTGGLTASAGIAASKFVAKVASDLRKPDGLVEVPAGREAEFLAPLAVEKLWGVGPKTAEVLHARGFRRIADLQALPPGILAASLGREAGEHLEHLARGIDPRPVEGGGLARSVSSETTFADFIPAGNLDAIDRVLLGLSEDVATRLRSIGARARRATLKVRDDRFSTCTRSRTFDPPTRIADDLFARARALYRERVEVRGRVRLLGVAASELLWGEAVQLDLLEGEDRLRADRLASAVDRIRGKLGDEAIRRGTLIDSDDEKVH